MALIFADGWDNYTDIQSNWTHSDANAMIDLSGTKSRTGIGCLLLTAASTQTLNINATQKLIAGTAYYTDAVGTQEILRFTDGVTAPLTTYSCRCWVTAAGEMQITTDSGGAARILATSAAGLFHFNSYNYVEVKAYADHGGTNGSVEVQLNGALVISATGIRFNFNNVGSTSFAQFSILCSGGLPDCRHDDTYLIDWTNPGPNDNFLGPIGVYTGLPTADAAVAWTPNVGVENFANVDEVPPDGDTTYNFDDVVGDTDQYIYPLTSVPANAQIFAVQDNMLLRTDSGARGVTSVVGGVQSTTDVALTAQYLFYRWQFDVNPDSGQGWQPSSFPIAAGPKVTS